MKTILRFFLVDDDEIFNMINMQIIKAYNKSFVVECFVSSVHALQELERLSREETNNFPDFIFLDINMPVMDGWEFLSRLNDLPSNESCKICMLTSSIDPMDEERAKKNQLVKDFFTKPLEADHLRKIL